ncbi:MAG: hypothetical protein DRP67_02310 [Candidatus Omnitrophota bacterium]|nr:MAG: hypothetical protein DRP67_02310 [Candidatus Omnitrophota bacterium]
MSKVFAVGIDGGSWNVFDYLIEKGVMPFLAGLKKKYPSGICYSVIPPMSPPAWTSFLTGVLPGKHGIYGFSYKPADSYQYSRIHDGRDISYPTIDKILKYYGKKTILVNIPMTFPPFKDAEVCISGMMSPSEKVDYIAPSFLRERFEKEGITYRIDFPYKKKEIPSIVKKDNGETFTKTLLKIEYERMKAVLHLIKEFEWDVTCYAITMTDRLQHFLWNFIFAESSKNRKITENVWKFYRGIDSILEKIYSQLNKEDKLIIFSDHGFGKYLGDFNVNRWLIKEGYLRRRKLWEIFYFYILKKLGKRKGSSLIDYQKSKCYMANVDSLNVNLKGREKMGSVEMEEYYKVLKSVKESLLNLKYKGKKIIERVYLGKELYGDNSPDIFYEFKKDYLSHGYISQIYNPCIILKSLKQGDHTREGIFLITEEPAQEINLSIVDILPVILTMTGCKIPSFIDGKLPKIIKEKVKEEIDHNFPFLPEEKIPSSEEINQQVAEKLKSLGYM